MFRYMQLYLIWRTIEMGLTFLLFLLLLYKKFRIHNPNKQINNFFFPYRTQELKLVLQEKTGKKSSDNMGYIILSCTLIPKTQDEKEAVSTVYVFLKDIF